MITDQQISEALDRIARTPDGELLYVYLQLERMSFPPHPEAGALQIHHGRRFLASELMKLMERGIEERGGRTSSTGDTSSGTSRRPIVYARRTGNTGNPGGRGARRRIAAGSVTGWDEPASSDTPGSK